jgi:hypothetical protein
MARFFLLVLFITLSALRSFSLPSDSANIVAVVQTTAPDPTPQQDLDKFTDRQAKVVRIHRAFAFVTAGLLVVGDALGTYHFFALRASGHAYCDAHSTGRESETADPAIYKAGILQAWSDPQSQEFRVLHGGTIMLATISYTATATMELTMPRMITDNRPLSSVNLHRDLFFVHAGLMLANIGLGFLESYALSKGNHDLVTGVGITHMVVGFALPVFVTASGLAYKLKL